MTTGRAEDDAAEPAEMSEDGGHVDPGERRRRLAEIFGDDLPEQTRDDQDPPSGSEEARKDEWLRRQVPPPHG